MTLIHVHALLVEVRLRNVDIDKIDIFSLGKMLVNSCIVVSLFHYLVGPEFPCRLSLWLPK